MITVRTVVEIVYLLAIMIFPSVDFYYCDELLYKVIIVINYPGISLFSENKFVSKISIGDFM